MSQRYLNTFALLIIFSFYISCEQDNYDEPEIKPNTYSFSFPNKVTFNYSQVSENRESIIPYSNTLNIKNISNESLSFDYVIFSFTNNILNYDNLNFIMQSSDEVEIDSTTNSVFITQTNTLFTDDNTITSVLNFNNESDHNLNGLYSGELNILMVTETDTTFQRSLLCTGLIDYQGLFNFFIENENEDDIVRLTGGLNSENLITGNILNRSSATFSSLTNNPQDTLNLEGANLKGYIDFMDNNEARLLEFNLTKQN
ncbi:hypothetical protein [Winogradskyella sp.]|uniref:hypothetical protein n=1 Tax=Winogradskyella sp. TaxID=1883156 RepID=UPI0026366327|nr:hypothetical protein [Winogradskyella sp.]